MFSFKGRATLNLIHSQLTVSHCQRALCGPGATCSCVSDFSVLIIVYIYFNMTIIMDDCCSTKGFLQINMEGEKRTVKLQWPQLFLSVLVLLGRWLGEAGEQAG